LFFCYLKPHRTSLSASCDLAFAAMTVCPVSGRQSLSTLRSAGFDD
jgi:hypothetical protein